MDEADGNVGTGPGVITNDGCAVEFYALLPTFGEPEIVHAAVPFADAPEAHRILAARENVGKVVLVP